MASQGARITILLFSLFIFRDFTQYARRIVYTIRMNELLIAAQNISRNLCEGILMEHHHFVLIFRFLIFSIQILIIENIPFCSVIDTHIHTQTLSGSNALFHARAEKQLMWTIYYTYNNSFLLFYYGALCTWRALPPSFVVLLRFLCLALNFNSFCLRLDWKKVAIVWRTPCHILKCNHNKIC